MKSEGIMNLKIASLVSTTVSSLNIILLISFSKNYSSLLDIFHLQRKSMNHKYAFVNKYLTTTTKTLRKIIQKQKIFYSAKKTYLCYNNAQAAIN